MSRKVRLITFACVFMGKKNSPKNHLEDWGFGEYMKEMKIVNKKNIFDNTDYIKKGKFNLINFIDFSSSFIHYNGDSTFEPCRDSKWFILNKPLYID